VTDTANLQEKAAELQGVYEQQRRAWAEEIGRPYPNRASEA